MKFKHNTILIYKGKKGGRKSTLCLLCHVSSVQKSHNVKWDLCVKPKLNFISNNSIYFLFMVMPIILSLVLLRISY